MILIGIIIGCVVFVLATLLCLSVPDLTATDWLLIGVVVVAAAICGYGASKYNNRK